MTGPDQQPDPFENAYLYAFPNPGRVGCPGSEVLRRLATKELPISHPARLHLMECSPCFQEFRQFQREAEAKQLWRRRQRTRVLLAGAAVVIFAVFLGWFWRRQTHRFHSEVATNHVPAGISNKVSSTLDFSVPVVREPGERPKEQVLSRATGPLSIRLQPGSGVGPYTVEIREARGQERTLASYSGVASADANGITTLQTHVDLSLVPPGTYIIAWHQSGAKSWDMGVFTVR